MKDSIGAILSWTEVNELACVVELAHSIDYTATVMRGLPVGTSDDFYSKYAVRRIFAMAIVVSAMFILMLVSAWHDSATFDEVEWIGAGFGCITQRAYWISREMPPFLRSLAALSAELVARPHMPREDGIWRGDLAAGERVR